ncbi:MAG TPA: hypothetical protein VJK25_00525 [Patescibacteria group bacterium]|nr:hypothetical protein [Patescibacteria group bacterium]
MHPDKWPEVRDKIKENFEVLDERREKNEDRKEDLEIIEFNGPIGKMKVEWLSRPKVLGKKTQYSRRIGSQVGVDYVYSEDEVTHTLKVYQWNEAGDSWQAMDPDLFA